MCLLKLVVAKEAALGEVLDVDAVGAFGDELGEAVCPFHDEDGVSLQVVLPADVQQLLRVFHAVEVEVDDGWGAVRVFVHEGEGGAGDFTLMAKGGTDALGDVGFPGSKIADKGDDVPTA